MDVATLGEAVRQARAFIRDSSGRRLDTFQALGFSDSYAPPLPTGLGWSASLYSLAPALANLGRSRHVGALGVTPEVLFNAKSTALSAPGATYYVNRSTGVDTNDGLTAGTAFGSLNKAQNAANTAGVPTKILVQGGAAGIGSATFERSRSFYSTAVAPTVDTAWVAVGGRVLTGTFDQFTSATPDATYPGCYTVTVANCDRVLDSANRDRFGNHLELKLVASAAICNVTPGTWFLTGSTLYIHRADGAAITTQNTRVYRNVSANYLVSNPVNIYMGSGGVDGSGFDLEGSAGAGVFVANAGSAATTMSPKIIVLAHCTFKYGGGAAGVSAVGTSLNNWNGAIFLFDCEADGNATDGFNVHNTTGAAFTGMVTVNCRAYDNGRGGAQSCNGHTAHENCVSIDVAGDYRFNRGGTLRNINQSKSYYLGTHVRDDLGDVILSTSGSIGPTAIRMDDTAEMWADRVTVDMGRGHMAWTTGSSTAKIHRRNCVTIGGQPDWGPGVIDAY